MKFDDAHKVSYFKQARMTVPIVCSLFSGLYRAALTVRIVLHCTYNVCPMWKQSLHICGNHYLKCV